MRVTASLKSALVSTSLLAGLAAAETAHAQWWTAAPADYEDCAERVEHSSASREIKAEALASCESRFAGRRKPGGGYSYHDFMQNRSFDIAGPNPTAAEQKMVDEHYKIYLDERRRSLIAAAFAEKQREVQAQETVGPRAEPMSSGGMASAAPRKEAASVALPRPRPKLTKPDDCADTPLACGWSKLSSGLQQIKDALFGAPAAARSRRT